MEQTAAICRRLNTEKCDAPVPARAPDLRRLIAGRVPGRVWCLGAASRGCHVGVLWSVVYTNPRRPRAFKTLGFLLILGCGWWVMWKGCSDPPEGFRHMACRNNLFQIALALHNYHDAYKCFPPAYVNDKDGMPMHSSAHLILPYMSSSPFIALQVRRALGRSQQLQVARQYAAGPAVSITVGLVVDLGDVHGLLRRRRPICRVARIRGAGVSDWPDAKSSDDPRHRSRRAKRALDKNRAI